MIHFLRNLVKTFCTRDVKQLWELYHADHSLTERRNSNLGGEFQTLRAGRALVDNCHDPTSQKRGVLLFVLVGVGTS